MMTLGDEFNLSIQYVSEKLNFIEFEEQKDTDNDKDIFGEKRKLKFPFG